MNTATPTAREQFTNDISLVLNNDRYSYEKIIKEARRLNNPYQLAEFIRDYVEGSIERSIKANPGAGELLIRQICYGWGIESYADYARDIIATIESEA